MNHSMHCSSHNSYNSDCDECKALINKGRSGEIFKGAVKRILPFGVFIEYLPGKEGLVPASKMSLGLVKHPDKVVAIGQQVRVKVVETDTKGQVILSMILTEAELEEVKTKEKYNDLEKNAAEKKAKETYKKFLELQKNSRYIYVSAQSTQELVVNVNKKIEEGYEPLGSPNINRYIASQRDIPYGGVLTTEEWTYLQFMLKSKKDKSI